MGGNNFDNSCKEEQAFPHEIHRSPANKSKEKRWYHDVADFANLLKSFIGTNYLALAYGISLAGLGLGIGGLIVVGALTAHCCHLIVKVKYHVIRQVLEKRRPLTASGSNNHSSSEEKAMYKHLQRMMTYADVGRIAYGNWGGRLVQIFLVVTQLGFCVNYQIFIGSNIYSMISPTMQNHTARNCTRLGHDADLKIASMHLQSAHAFDLPHRLDGPEFAESLISNVTLHNISPTASKISTSEIGSASYSAVTMEMPSTHVPLGNATISPPRDATSWTPSLTILVLLPLPFFIFFTLFRNLRVMGFTSLIANGMMSAGYFVVVAYICATFKPADDLKWFKWTTFPVFLGQAAASYEAIGTLLSIEASMDGNHHRYPICLYFVVGVFSTMLSLSAMLGYLQYGDNTAQILVQNLPQTGSLILTVNVALVIAVLFTYPLQVYPVIEIVEGVLFGEGGCFGPHQKKLDSKSSTTSLVTDETQPLLDSSRGEDVEKSREGLVVIVIPDSVPTWKRNVFRVSIALLIAGLGVIFKDVFAYINAFVGAVGSCPLAFVLPCLFHLKLCWSQLSRAVIVKDIVIIIVGSAIGITSLVVVIQQIVVEMSGHGTAAQQCA